MVDFRPRRADRESESAAIGDRAETEFVAGVVADEHRPAPDERRALEEAAHRLALVDAARLDLIGAERVGQLEIVRRAALEQALAAPRAAARPPSARRGNAR